MKAIASLESGLEAALLVRVRGLGGVCLKVRVEGENGHPDRWIKLPGKPLAVIELKRKGREPGPLQMHRLAEWRRLGVVAEWADDMAGVERFLAAVEAQP